MLLENIATIRTGVVTTRKKASKNATITFKYNVLNLRCAQPSGYFDMQYAEVLESEEELKDVYFTRMGDILVRLSAPYTAIMITKEEWCNYLVPSHFAIIRVDETLASPEYVLWFLKRETTKQKILQNISGSGVFGTINSKFFNTLTIREISIERQRIIGQMLLLADREQELLQKLTLEKECYNKLLVEKIYESVKRGN